MKIRKGDTVQIMSGTDAGKVGRVIKVYLDRDRILVEGINIVKKHTRPSQDNPQGGIIEKEASIHVSNTLLMIGGKSTKMLCFTAFSIENQPEWRVLQHFA